jgi:hypothetical protein
MIAIIDGKRYDTDKAELIFQYWNGKPTNDFKYRTKTLYRTKLGSWFLHHYGGPLTDMGVDGGYSESIEPMTDIDQVYNFLERSSSEPEALKAIETYFPDRIVDA